MLRTTRRIVARPLITSAASTPILFHTALPINVQLTTFRLTRSFTPILGSFPSPVVIRSLTVLPAMARPSLTMGAPHASFGTLQSAALTVPVSIETKTYHSVSKAIPTPMRHRVDKRFFTTSNHDKNKNVEPDTHQKILTSVKDEGLYKFKQSTIQNLKNAGNDFYRSTAMISEPIFNWLSKRFITPEAFDILSDEDQKILLQLLHSNIGQYALTKEYISIQKFLILDKDSRNDLMVLLEYAEAEKHYSLYCKNIVDRVFSDKEFLRKFSLLPSECRRNIKNDPDRIIELMNGSSKAMELYGISVEHQKLLIAKLKSSDKVESKEEITVHTHKTKKATLHGLFCFPKLTAAELKKDQEIKDIQQYIDKIRNISIPMLEGSGNLAHYAESIAVYIEYLIGHKKGLPDIPDQISVLKMLNNTQSSFESELLTHSTHNQKEAIKVIRDAINFCCYEDEELAHIHDIYNKEITF